LRKEKGMKAAESIWGKDSGRVTSIKKEVREGEGDSLEGREPLVWVQTLETRGTLTLLKKGSTRKGVAAISHFERVRITLGGGVKERGGGVKKRRSLGGRTSLKKSEERGIVLIRSQHIFRKSRGRGESGIL